MFERDQVQKAVGLYDQLVNEGKNPVFLADGEMVKALGQRKILNLGDTDEQMASNLYELLREGEKYDCIITFKLKLDSELMLSVNNRFTKAFFKE